MAQAAVSIVLEGRELEGLDLEGFQQQRKVVNDAG